jgi:hypothetical protein
MYLRITFFLTPTAMLLYVVKTQKLYWEHTPKRAFMIFGSAKKETFFWIK